MEARRGPASWTQTHSATVLTPDWDSIVREAETRGRLAVEESLSTSEQTLPSTVLPGGFLLQTSLPMSPITNLMRPVKHLSDAFSLLKTQAISNGEISCGCSGLCNCRGKESAVC